MKMSGFFIAAALSALLATPVAAQQQLSPLTSPAHSRAPVAVPLTEPNTTNAQRNSGFVDINSASPSQLDALPGMNASNAQAIVAHRPYKAKDELVQRNIVPTNVYDKIKDRIVAIQGAPGAVSSGSTVPPASPGTGGAK
jgi:competence protein ComEA